MSDLEGQILKPKTHPVFRKYEKSKKLDIDKYWKIHTDFLVPLDIKIDAALFRKEIESYKENFKSWGFNKPELDQVRKGLPLVNLDGMYSNKEDISIGPLDQHNSAFPNNCYLENDFTVPTEVLNISSLEPLTSIKKYMCRSSILHWKPPANFSPHWDIILPTVNLRLWGTDNPDNVELRYKKNGELVPCDNVEAGRLYLIDTSTIHDARCVKDEVYQYFIALNVNSYDTIRELIDV